MPLERVIPDVYVAERLKDMVRLYNRNYDVLAEIIPVRTRPATLLFHGACVCARWDDWKQPESEAFWFCLNAKNERATAEIWREDDGRMRQVVISQEGCDRD